MGHIDEPQYWLRFDTLANAQACLDYINNLPSWPLTGVKALTGMPATDKQKFETWHYITECTDGKFAFQLTTEEQDAFISLSHTNKTQIITKYQALVEEFDPAWIPESV